MRHLAATLLLLALAGACRSKVPSDHHAARVAAARQLTALCANSRLRSWNVRARAAGADCSVLYVQTSVILEDALIEALHYGTAPYAPAAGGVRKFSRDRAFRGVAYKDATGKLWTYGKVSADEAEVLVPCH